MATTLANAYVQVLPSAKGMKENLTKALGGGKGAGQSFGSGFAGAIKNALVTAGIGAALGKALTEGAGLEQSLGGVETLFGDHADKLIQQADQAYRTAGMSANAYMELATSFSASLLQSLGGDTAAAATMADMAMTDMSDNANKMGTDMELIKNAYQGFSKQNYTMLDNLKLGYGGTQKEMQRLLADAEKLSGTKYDINSLADVYSAIHVIQGELQITGTTAKEAASTIGGSAHAMSAAFKNLLGNLTLGRDIGPSLNALADTTTTFLVGNLLPAVWNIVKALPSAAVTFVRTAAPQMAQGFMAFLPELRTAVKTGIPQLWAAANDMIWNVVIGLQRNFPRIIDAGGQLLGKLVSGVAQAVPKLLQTGVAVIGQLAFTITGNFPQIVQTGGALLHQLVTGLLSGLPELLRTGARLVLNLLENIAGNYPAVIKSGFDLLVKLIKGIGDALPNLVTAAGDIVSMIWDTIKETDWLQLGKDIISGLIDGIGAMAGALWDAAKGVGRSVLDSIKGALDINSPSRKMRDEVGRFVPEGLAIGIVDNLAPIRSAMRKMAGIVTLPFAPGSLRLDSVPGGMPAYAGHNTYFYQTIHTHDKLSGSELTREAEDMLERQKWGLP